MSGGFFPPGSPRLPHHPFAMLFPMLGDTDLDQLGDDIKENGQAETIKIFEGMILDGRNREEACARKGIGVRYEQFVGDRRQALAWVVTKNLRRRHLTEDDRLRIGANIAKFKLGFNQYSRPAAPIGAPSLPIETDAPAPQNDGEPMSTQERADLLQVSRRGLQRADVLYEKGAPELQQAFEQGKVAVSTAADIAEALPVEEQKQVAQMTDEQILEKASQIRKAKNDKRRTERIEKIKKIAEGNSALPSDRKWPVLYIDPPTKFAAGDSDRSTENHYPTMTEDDLAKLPIGELATDDAVLFVWTTVPWLRKTLRLIEDAWGFAYVSEFIWDKRVAGLGFWNRNRHESLLIATRGKMPAPDPEVLEPSLYPEEKGEHSAKPDYFRGLISTYYPDLPKLELFARVDKMPEGWTAWGNQARVPAQPALGLEAAE